MKEFFIDVARSTLVTLLLVAVFIGGWAFRGIEGHIEHLDGEELPPPPEGVDTTVIGLPDGYRSIAYHHMKGGPLCVYVLSPKGRAVGFSCVKGRL